MNIPHKKTAGKIFLILAIVYVIISLGVGIYVSESFSFPRFYSTEYTIQDGLKKGEFDRAFVDLPWTVFRVKSPHGYELEGVSLPGKNGRTMIFCHGHTWTWYGMAKYMRPFIKEGWNVVAYDHRSHGQSSGSGVTGGYLEKHDLARVVDWVMKRFPDTRLLGAFGESMGSSTILQYLPLDSRLDLAIADCPYSDLAELLNYQMKINYIPAVFRPAALAVARIYFRVRPGFPLSRVSPEKEILEGDASLLLIHGSADHLVPTSMSQRMYAMRKDRYHTELFIQEGASHAKSLAADPDLYMRRVRAFIRTAERVRTGGRPR